MRLAAVDIGSNTVHALVADAVRGKLEDLGHYVEMPELGPHVSRTGVIGSRGRVALRALRKVVAQAQSHGCDTLIAGATHAVREASDGPAFVRQASEVMGVPVRILSARREAQLSFIGVASRHASRREWVMVDLGGGSSEVVIGRSAVMLRASTLPIGSGVLARQYLSDPPKVEERARLRRAALRELARAPDGDVERLVVTGGTASNLPLVLSRRSPPSVLTTADLLACEAKLDRKRAAQVAAEVGLETNRVKALRAGVEVLLLLLDWYGLALLHVSLEGLRHGMLLAYLENGGDWWRDPPHEIA
jgi:exopolyphosphatase / guanosine-5'-triphosphate,3'-diphosphate pyrophosphatase